MTTDTIQNCIDNQFGYNSRRNIFCDNNDTDWFTSETEQSITAIRNAGYSANISETLADRAVKQFCKVNQYYSFSGENIQKLIEVYDNLISSVCNTELPISTIAFNHKSNLKTWLAESNPFATKLYDKEQYTIQEVACYEYSALLQLDVLNIDINTIAEPVLDIGCGESGNLVNYLRKCGIEAYGIDRLVNNCEYLTGANWFEYDISVGKWGTVVSNLGFSNHFKHHHLRSDGDFTGYARRYMDILRSLKPGGSFCYAPDLPFIEIYLDRSEYHIERKDVTGKEFKSVKITRLR